MSLKQWRCEQQQAWKSGRMAAALGIRRDSAKLPENIQMNWMKGYDNLPFTEVTATTEKEQDNGSAD